jgi:hypothetical protein
VSDYALVHSNEGTFTQVKRKGDRLRLKSGGHGQKGMELLDRYGIEYNVVKTYSNGVRVGNIPDHKNPLKKSGTGQAWFPQSWSEKDIRRAGEHVAGLKSNRHVKDGQSIYGVYKGVRVGVKRTRGNPGTVFPDSNQSIYLKRKRRKKA